MQGFMGLRGNNALDTLGKSRQFSFEGATGNECAQGES
jgi:hypothetical protein